MQLPLHIGCQGKDGSDWGVPSYWCKGLLIVDSLFLRESSSYKSFLVFFYTNICGIILFWRSILRIPLICLLVFGLFLTHHSLLWIGVPRPLYQPIPSILLHLQNKLVLYQLDHSLMPYNWDMNLASFFLWWFLLGYQFFLLLQLYHEPM